jgi:hypothetical protein
MRQHHCWMVGWTAIFLLLSYRSCLADLTFTVEVEPNDTFALAQVITTFHPPVHTEGIQGTITPGDVDIFALFFPAPGTFVLQLMPLPFGSVHGMQLGVFDAMEAPIVVQNQFGGAILVQVTAASPGIYYAGVSGLTDIPLSGLHNETFQYNLSVSYFSLPGPSALAAMGVFFALGARRRRRVC